MNTGILESHAELTDKVREQADALSAEQRERLKQDEGIRKLIDEAIAEGLAIEVVGLVWLVFGLLFSTSSTELANLFSG